MKKLKILLLGLTLVSISSMVKCGQLYVKNCMNKNINLDITTTNNKTNNIQKNISQKSSWSKQNIDTKKCSSIKISFEKISRKKTILSYEDTYVKIIPYKKGKTFRLQMKNKPF